MSFFPDGVEAAAKSLADADHKFWIALSEKSRAMYLRFARGVLEGYEEWEGGQHEARRS